MYQFHLQSDETLLILAPRWSEFDPILQFSLLAFLLAVPLVLLLALYRYELRLIARRPACGLLLLRLIIVLVLWLVIGLQPHLVDVHVEETPGRVRIAVDLSASMDVADVPSAFAPKLGSADSLTRKQIVAKILGLDGMNLLERLAERHQVEIVGFHRQAGEMPASQLVDVLTGKREGPEYQATDLLEPLAKPRSSQAQPLFGIVLFSDGRHNADGLLDQRAAELGKQRIPIFPVLIGSREPPSDLTILEVNAPTKAFKGADIAVHIRCQVTNMPAQEMTVEMQIAGKPPRFEHRRVIVHKGKDEVYSLQFDAKLEDAGTHALTIQAASKSKKEITLANNQATRFIRIDDDKVKLLLVDGEARWEYHYLANALLRDPTIALERVVFTQPRIGALKEDQFDKAGLPKLKLPELKGETKGVDPLFDYDCIILGDVSPEQLPMADRKRLEKYVADRGGTLILSAGKRYLPLAYTKDADDPLTKMLPITEPRELVKDKGFLLKISSEGRLRPFLQLDPEQPANPWPELPQHFWGVVGKRRPAASVLLTPALGGKEDADTGILLQQNYGFGLVLFLGLDSTWRWRMRAGDEHHHRFWGQLARWSAAEKLLLAGNRNIRYGPRDPVYVEGKEVELAARVSAALPPLQDATSAQAKLFRQHADGAEELAAVLPLTKNSRRETVLEAKARDLPPGTYRMELDMPAYREQLAEPGDDNKTVKDRDLFRILPREERELLDLSTNGPLLQSIAEKSDGKLYTPANVEEVIDRLARRIERKEYRTDTRPWQDVPMVWWTLGVLLGLLTAEWTWRKWLDLP